MICPESENEIPTNSADWSYAFSDTLEAVLLLISVCRFEERVDRGEGRGGKFHRILIYWSACAEWWQSVYQHIHISFYSSAALSQYVYRYRVSRDIVENVVGKTPKWYAPKVRMKFQRMVQIEAMSHPTPLHIPVLKIYSLTRFT